MFFWTLPDQIEAGAGKLALNLGERPHYPIHTIIGVKSASADHMSAQWFPLAENKL
jgi:hypothetical protein